jgi:hypothetical protein
MRRLAKTTSAPVAAVAWLLWAYRLRSIAFTLTGRRVTTTRL